MTTSQAIPTHGLARVLQVDLGQEAAAAGRLVADFTADAGLGLRGVAVPVLSPLAAEDVPGGPEERVFDAATRSDIQGNVIPGFAKNHQHFLFLRITEVKAAKAFLDRLTPRISTMEEVLAFRSLYRAARLRVGRHRTGLCATWLNIAFSHRAIAALVSEADAARFGDASFRLGLAARSAYLGDPTDPCHPGSPGRWTVGGPEHEADIVLIAAADRPDSLDAVTDGLRGDAAAAGLELLFEQRGDALPGPLRGHEHFGFKDGISQPGLRGKLSAAPGDYITPRYFSPTDPRRLYMAKPGQLLVWPGHVLLGEDRPHPDPPGHPHPPGAAAVNFPEWAARGSYLVVRRLHQDVNSFYGFVAAGAELIGLPADQFAAMLVGRWPSGAPLLRAPNADDPALAEDDFANNHFIFDDRTRQASLRPIPGYPGDTYPQAHGDFLGQVCPHFAHIRKVNPRDTATDLGETSDSLLRMLLRRGIPYGPPLLCEQRPSDELVAQDRGLMFVCYGASIEDQFEFVARRWSNSVAQPNLGGYDPIIGQNGRQGSRNRFIDVPTPTGPVRLGFDAEWITPTGGGYFFAPTVSAIKNILAAVST